MQHRAAAVHLPASCRARLPQLIRLTALHIAALPCHLHRWHSAAQQKSSIWSTHKHLRHLHRCIFSSIVANYFTQHNTLGPMYPLLGTLYNIAKAFSLYIRKNPLRPSLVNIQKFVAKLKKKWGGENKCTIKKEGRRETAERSES